MRTILTALAFLTATLALSTAAQAEITYPWCITGSRYPYRRHLLRTEPDVPPRPG